MVTNLQHRAGLNPRGFRLLQELTRKSGVLPKKSVVDFRLVLQFAFLSAGEQRDLARQIGTDVHTILEDLLIVDMACDLF